MEPNRSALVRAIIHFSSKISVATTRRSILRNAELCVNGLSYEGDAVSFSNDLMTALDEQGLHPKSGLPNLVVFLRYLLETDPKNYGLTADDEELLRNFVDAEVNAFEARRQAEQQRRQSTLDRLSARKQAAGALSVSKHYALDDDAVLLEFDLEDQVATFQLSLPKTLRGFINITVGGPYSLLREYVVERIRGTLEARGLEVFPYEIRVGPSEITNLWESVRLEERVSDAEVETLLLVFHHEIPYKDMCKLAEDFVKEANERVLPLLEQKQRLLILVWAHEGGDALDIPVRLPALEPFYIDSVAKWLKKKLEKKVESSDLECCLEYLRTKLTTYQGYPEHTYVTMRQILRTLRG